MSGYKLLRNVLPDAIFLDVQMGDGTGFDLLRKFHDPGFQVIFTTAFDEFAIKAFQVNAIDYLLKPIDVDELLRAVGKIEDTVKRWKADERMQNLLTSDERKEFEKIAISSNEGLHFVELKDIVRLESDANYTTFYLGSGERVTVARTLKNFDELLPPDQFFRSHQSHIINLSHVKKIVREDGGYILLSGDIKIPLARSKKDRFMEVVKGRYLQ